MPGPQTTLLIEGSFRELAEELADYLDAAKKDESKPVRTQIEPLLEQVSQLEEKGDEAEDEADDARDKVLDALVASSALIHQGPEQQFTAAYNLLIHLIKESGDINKYLQTITRQLSNPDSISSNSPSIRYALTLSTLSTIFNILDEDDSVRYPILSAAIDVIGKAGSFEPLRSHLKYIDSWLRSWKANPAQSRRLLLKISTVAKDAGEDDASYDYLLRALRTIPSGEVSSEEAQSMSLEALRAALLSPTHYDFEDLTGLDSVQALRTSNPVYYQLLEIFTSDSYDDFLAFQEEHPSWLAEQKLDIQKFDEGVLARKMRLLTIASLASAASQTRTLPYQSIATALRIPPADVETWVIDAIRVQLVEGKLSQLRKEFLIHRSTYRVFGTRQWQEVAGRLAMWRESLHGVLDVVRRQKEEMAAQREAELRGLEQRMAGANINGGAVNGTGGGGGAHNRRQREPVENGLDGLGA